jgi:hypothetical protein
MNVFILIISLIALFSFLWGLFTGYVLGRCAKCEGCEDTECQK